MKKPLVVVYCVIILCSLLAVPLLKPVSPTSQVEPQTIPQSTSQPTPPQSTPTSTPQSTPQTNPQPPPTGAQQPTNRTLKQAVGNATNYLAHTQEPYLC
jgi:hypothetical protein